MTALQILLTYLKHHRDQRRIPAIADAAGVPRRSVQSILDGKVPSLCRAESVAHALGLEFYIGPPRDSSATIESGAARVHEEPTADHPDPQVLCSRLTEIADKLAQTQTEFDALLTEQPRTGARKSERIDAGLLRLVIEAVDEGLSSVAANIDFEKKLS